MQRAVQRGDPGRDGRERVDLGRAHAAHGARRAVLLVVGVQDEEDLERALQHRVRLVPAADREGHVDEVADVVELVAREHVREPARMAEGEGGDRRHLGDQAHSLQAAVLGIRDVLGVGVEGRERTDRAQQHPHRVRVVAEPLEELRHVRVHVGVQAHLVLPRLELGRRRQLSLEQEVRGLEEARLLRDLLDRVAAVAQDAGIAVDVRDRAAAVRRVEECRVVGEQPAVAIGGADLREVGRPDGAVDDRDGVLLARAVVDDRQCVARHDLLPLESSLTRNLPASRPAQSPLRPRPSARRACTSATPSARQAARYTAAAAARAAPTATS